MKSLEQAMGEPILFWSSVLVGISLIWKMAVKPTSHRVVRGVRAMRRFVKRIAAFLDDWFGHDGTDTEGPKPGMPSRVGRLEVSVETIRHQVLPNNGGSIVDRVERLGETAAAAQIAAEQAVKEAAAARDANTTLMATVDEHMRDASTDRIQLREAVEDLRALVLGGEHDGEQLVRFPQQQLAELVELLEQRREREHEDSGGADGST